jgi:hypothetical protein
MNSIIGSSITTVAVTCQPAVREEAGPSVAANTIIGPGPTSIQIVGFFNSSRPLYIYLNVAVDQ